MSNLQASNSFLLLDIFAIMHFGWMKCTQRQIISGVWDCCCCCREQRAAFEKVTNLRPFMESCLHPASGLSHFFLHVLVPDTEYDLQPSGHCADDACAEPPMCCRRHLGQTNTSAGHWVCYDTFPPTVPPEGTHHWHELQIITICLHRWIQLWYQLKHFYCKTILICWWHFTFSLLMNIRFPIFGGCCSNHPPASAGAGACHLTQGSQSKS